MPTEKTAQEPKIRSPKALAEGETPNPRPFSPNYLILKRLTPKTLTGTPKIEILRHTAA